MISKVSKLKLHPSIKLGAGEYTRGIRTWTRRWHKLRLVTMCCSLTLTGRGRRCMSRSTPTWNVPPISHTRSTSFKRMPRVRQTTQKYASRDQVISLIHWESKVLIEWTKLFGTANYKNKNRTHPFSRSFRGNLKSIQSRLRNRYRMSQPPAMKSKIFQKHK